jgi:hypothetical protein
MPACVGLWRTPSEHVLAFWGWTPIRSIVPLPEVYHFHAALNFLRQMRASLSVLLLCHGADAHSWLDCVQ